MAAWGEFVSGAKFDYRGGSSHGGTIDPRSGANLERGLTAGNIGLFILLLLKQLC